MDVNEAIIYIMKMRKRHVRLALARIQAARENLAVMPCPCAMGANDARVCGRDSRAEFKEVTGEYLGHRCDLGHLTLVPKRQRDPTAPRPSIEKADVRSMPSQGRQPAPISAQELQNLQQNQRQLQHDIEAKLPREARSWKDGSW